MKLNREREREREREVIEQQKNRKKKTKRHSCVYVLRRRSNGERKTSLCYLMSFYINYAK